MNKAELVEKIVAGTDLNKTQATKTLNLILNCIIEEVSEGNDVSFVGFGTFKPQARKARKGHNPLTGESLMIPAKNVVVFRMGKKLKEAVNK